MLSNVSIFCFTASYGVALALEITRLFFRSGVRGAVMLAFAGAGLLAHTVFLFHDVSRFDQLSPLSTMRHWHLATAWVLVVLYLFFTLRYPKVQFGLFLLPLALGLIGAGTLLTVPQSAPSEPYSMIWGIIHGVSILIATVSVLVGFAAGVMYLGQARRLKHKQPAPRQGLRLPSLEWLQRANSQSIYVALVTLGMAIVSGVILNVVHRAPGEDFVPWTDPVVVSTGVMFGWLFLSTGFGLFYKPAREGRKVAYLTVVSFVFLAIVLGTVLLVDTRHRRRRDSGGPRGRAVETRPVVAIAPAVTRVEGAER